MSIEQYKDKKPTLAKGVFVHESAVVLGDVEIGAGSSIWPGAVIRGDVNYIRIGKRTSIQDNSVIHVTHDGKYTPGGQPTIVGNDVTVGHRVLLHGCTIEDHCLIGMGSIVMDAVNIERNVILGAGSLVPPGKVLTSGYLWMGSPVKKIRPLTQTEVEQLDYNAKHYERLKDSWLQA